jgi:hypothetical protein
MDLSPNSLRLWHYRFGHLNFESLSKLKTDEMVKGLPTFEKKIVKSEACIIGKQKRDPFLISTWRANRCLQLIQSDICGPMESSLGGCKMILQEWIGSIFWRTNHKPLKNSYIFNTWSEMPPKKRLSHLE